MKEVFSLQNQHLAELSHLDRRLTGCLREKTYLAKVLILNEVRDVCLGLFINDWHLSSDYEIYFLAQFPLYHTVVVNCVHPFLQDEAHVWEKFNWETAQDVYTLQNSPVEVNDDLASEVVIKHCEQLVFLNFVEFLQLPVVLQISLHLLSESGRDVLLSQKFLHVVHSLSEVRGEQVKFGYCPAYISNDVSKHAWLRNHDQDSDNAFISVDRMYVSIAHSARSGDNPV